MIVLFFRLIRITVFIYERKIKLVLAGLGIKKPINYLIGFLIMLLTQVNDLMI